MKRVPLTPYPGTLVVCTRAQFEARYRREWGNPPDLRTSSGTTSILPGKGGTVEYWVWAKDKDSLVHELAHVALLTFELIGSDPRSGDGEPFCYLLGHLFASAKS